MQLRPFRCPFGETTEQTPHESMSTTIEHGITTFSSSEIGQAHFLAPLASAEHIGAKLEGGRVNNSASKDTAGPHA